MRSLQFPRTEPGLAPIVAAAFPSYRKKTIWACEFSGPMNVNSYWDGGSRDEYKLVHLATLRVIPFPSTHPVYDRTSSGARCGEMVVNDLPEGTALVSGGTFCGKPATVTIHLRPENMVRLLPAPDKREAIAASTLVASRNEC